MAPLRGALLAYPVPNASIQTTIARVGFQATRLDAINCKSPIPALCSVVLVHRELEFVPVGVIEGRGVTSCRQPIAASCRGGLSRSCQSRSIGPIILAERSEAEQLHPALAPVLAPGTALGVLPSRALSSAQAVFHFRERTFVTQPPAGHELSPDGLWLLPACDRVRRR